jgi:putative methionine-R-sulfoxide reductase with GAF domain
VPIRARDGRVAAVLDIDSVRPADFSAVDEQALEDLCELLQPLFE